MSLGTIAILVCLGVFVLALMFAGVMIFRKRKGLSALPSLPASFSVAKSVVEPSIEELLVKIDDRIDLNGKLTAASRRVTKLTDAAADEHEARLTSRLAPKEQAPPPPPSP